MNTYYIKIDAQNVVRDVLSYPHDNYIKINIAELPEGSYAGYYKYIDNQFVLDESLLYLYIDSLESEEYKIQLFNRLTTETINITK